MYVYSYVTLKKISTLATKRLLLISHCFGIIEICKRFGLRPVQYTSSRSHFALSSYQLIAESFSMPSYPHVSLEALLESSPLPEGLANTLGNAWTVPGTRGCLPKAYPATGDPTGAKPKSGEPLLRIVTSLVVRQVPVSEAICILGFRENAKIVLVHSLYLLTYTPSMSSFGESWGDYLRMGTRPSFSSLGFTSIPTYLSEESPAPSLIHILGASTSIPEGPTPTPIKFCSSPTRARSRFYLVNYAYFLQR